MSSLESLLTTKLYLPPARLTLVPRPRLVALLSDGLSRPLTLISSPAGFGKTTLLSEWRASDAGRSFSLAWLSLDDDDNNPARFLTYLASALRTLKGDVGETALAALQQPQPPPPSAILTSLVNDLGSIAASFALVLDDYHVINSQPVHEALLFLVDHLPPQMHLVLLTRADPPLPLARLRARDQLTEIRTAELRFTPQESASFLNEVMGLELPADDIETLETRTEGWIAGLQLAAISLRQQADKHAFVRAFAGDDRYVVDYLLEEVLQRQPPAVQRFLLQTSILERLCGPLCEAVTGQAENLAVLEQSNLFVTPLDNRRYWYRYHPLFADLLRRRLRQSLPPDEWTALYRQACAWYEGEGHIGEAVSQALSAGDFEYMASLLDRHVLTLFFRGETMRVHRWLEALPEDVLSAHPLLCAAYANTLAHVNYYAPGSLRQTEGWLDTAERALAEREPRQAAPGPVGYDVTRSFIALSRAYLAFWRGDTFPSVISLAQHALAGLPPVEDAVDPNFLRFRSGLNFNLGIVYLRSGNEEAASRAFAQAWQIGEACGDLLNAGAAVYVQSKILQLRGRLAEAVSLCQDALKSLDRKGHAVELSSPYIGMIYVALGQVFLEWNDLEAAESLLEKGMALSRLTTGTDIQLQSTLAVARLWRARGDYVSALNTLDQFEGGTREDEALIACYRLRVWLAQGKLTTATRQAGALRLEEASEAESFALARVLIAQREAGLLPDLGLLLKALDDRIRAAEGRGWVERRIELLILQALAHQAQQDFDRASASLQRALKLAEPGGYVRIFVDEDSPMRRLLVRLRDRRGAPTEYISKLLKTWGEPEAIPHLAQGLQPLVEPLSARELEVLCLLAEGHSNAEIARKLFISLNTTKKHVTHILGKLAVNNRAQAVARAWELGLVVYPKR